VENNFNFEIDSMCSELNLRRPIYKETASKGYFCSMDPRFTWEKPKAKLLLEIEGNNELGENSILSNDDKDLKNY